MIPVYRDGKLIAVFVNEEEARSYLDGLAFWTGEAPLDEKQRATNIEGQIYTIGELPALVG